MSLTNTVSAQLTYNEKRQQVLQAVYEQHPERFMKGAPIPPQLPSEAWIDPPTILHGAAGESEPETSLFPTIRSQPSDEHGTTMSQPWQKGNDTTCASVIASFHCPNLSTHSD